jgi:hypothetical protein
MCRDEYFGCFDEVVSHLNSLDDTLTEIKEILMDKKIKKIQHDTKKLEKEESSLLKADKKRDKVCDYGEKMMKKK